MSDPHNPSRYGETWPQHRINACLSVLWVLKPHVVLSGGWAWHFLSPEDHEEYKHLHDHKDLDLMVPPRTVATTMNLILGLGFRKTHTRFDGLSSKEEFRRYEKYMNVAGHPSFKLTIDFFVRDVPTRQVRDGFLVVDPVTLLSLYQTIHTSKSCFAVLAARRLLRSGIDPQDRKELIQMP